MGLWAREDRGKQAAKSNIAEGFTDYPNFQQEFGHLAGNPIIGLHHKSVLISLVECLSNVIVTLKTEGRKAADREKATTHWLQKILKTCSNPVHLIAERNVQIKKKL